MLYKTKFSNTQSVKFSITEITQTPTQYYQSLNSIQGDSFQERKGISFDEIVIRSLNYLFIECINTRDLKDSDYTLEFAKSILDRNNETGYTPVLNCANSTNIDVIQKEFFKECFAFIQLAYYLNSIELEKNQFFIYINHYLKTGSKLPENLYKLDVNYLNKKYNDYKDSDSKGFKTVAQSTIKNHFFGCLFIICNDLGLSTSLFKVDSKEGRDYNPIVKVNREFRKYFPFLLNEFDIKQAYPSFIDSILDTNCAPTLYDCLSKEFNLTRSEAKIKFNTLLNSGAYHNEAYFYEFLNPIYQDKTKDLIKIIKDKKYPFWKRMQHLEHIAIDVFKNHNKIKNVTRLHDAILVIDDIYCKDIRTEFIEYSFGFKQLNPFNSLIDFKVSTKKQKYYYVSSVPKEIKSTLKCEWDNKGGSSYRGEFFNMYQNPFSYKKASFNIANLGTMKGDVFERITEKDFLESMFNCIAVIQDLNNDLTFEGLSYVIKKIVDFVAVNGAYSFNKKALIDLLISKAKNESLTLIIKTKNWDFKGSHDLNNIDLYTFQKLKYEADLEAKIFFQSLSIFDIVKDSYSNGRKKFIDFKNLGISKRKESLFICDIIERFNAANGFGDIRTATVINDVIKQMCTKSETLYKDNYYRVSPIARTHTQTSIAQDFNINRRTAKKVLEWLNFNQDKKDISEIYWLLKTIIENKKGTDIQIQKINGHLEVVEIKEQEKQVLPLVQKLSPDLFGFITDEMQHLEQEKINKYKIEKEKYKAQLKMLENEVKEGENKVFQLIDFKKTDIIKHRLSKIIYKVYAYEFETLSTHDIKKLIWKYKLFEGLPTRQWSETEINDLEERIYKIKHFNDRRAV